VSDDLHTPTNAGPEPAPAVTEPVVAAPVTPEPTPVVTEADATATHPIGTAAYSAPGGGPAAAGTAEKPEVQAAAAFAGGLVLALILKRLGR
jgi:hypothetical protein